MNLQDVMLSDTHTERGNGTMMSQIVKKVRHEFIFKVSHRSVEDAHSSKAPDPTSTLMEVRVCSMFVF